MADLSDEDWADIFAQWHPTVCWNVLYVCLRLTREPPSQPRLEELVYKNQLRDTWTFAEWLLSKGRKAMALKYCRRFGDEEACDFLVNSCMAATVARNSSYSST